VAAGEGTTVNLIDLADIHAAARGVKLPPSSLFAGVTSPQQTTRKQRLKIAAMTNTQRRSLTNINARRQAR
jgi:hypothetical protein